MKISTNSGDANAYFKNNEIVLMIRSNNFILKDYLSRVNSDNGSEQDMKELFILALHSANNLYVFSRFFTLNSNIRGINKYISEEELVDIGKTLLRFMRMHKGSLKGKSENVVKEFLYSLNKSNQSRKMVLDLCDMLVKKLNNSGINTYVHFSNSTNSVYIKPDSGILKTIRVSDHEGVSGEFQHKYSIVCVSDRNYFRRTPKYYNMDRVIVTKVGRNNFDEAIRGIRLAIIEEKSNKIKNMMEVVYQRAVSNNTNNLNRANFKKVKTIY